VAITKTRLITTVPDNPDLYGPSLAQIIKLEPGKEILIGQAWLVDANILATCGHVVENYADSPNAIVVKFPASGNRYAVQAIQLHPSFVRQPDGLVKFDIAVLKVLLSQPDASAQPLPITYDQALKSGQEMATVRYPVHLGVLTAAPQPLPQLGKFLGYLRKHDNFHMLHDLPLAPGDSGSPLFAGPKVVAIHCGDTATLPGLNLPTTSIRLALWIDALRELGVRETVPAADIKRQHLLASVFVCLVAMFFGLILGCFQHLPAFQKQWRVVQPTIQPIDVSFNKPLRQFHYGDDSQVVMMPRSDCYLYLFDVDKNDKVVVMYPPYGFTAFVRAGQPRTVDRIFGNQSLKVNNEKDKLHVVGLGADFPLVRGSDWAKDDPIKSPLTIDANELLERIDDFVKADPNKVVHLVMDAPTANGPPPKDGISTPGPGKDKEELDLIFDTSL
jgi:hypothetical protein